MSFSRIALLLCPLAYLLAQSPSPVSQQTLPPAQRQATPVPPATPASPAPGTKVVNPDGTVTMTMPIAPAPAQVPPDKIVLNVGELTLTAKQFDEIIDGLPEQYKGFARGPGRKQFADQLVRVLVMAEEGRRRKFDQKPSFQTEAKFQADQVLATITAQAINQETKLDDAQLHKYYDDHKAEYEQIHARHILVRFQGSSVPLKPGSKELSDAEALVKAQDLEKRLHEGGDFASLANAESDDGNGNTGGDLGTFGRGRMVPSFEEAAFKMQAGQISDPVKSQFGYHIIKVESVEIKTFDQVKPDIEKKLRPEEANKAMAEIQKNTKVVYDPVFFGMEKQ